MGLPHVRGSSCLEKRRTKCKASQKERPKKCALVVKGGERLREMRVDYQ